MKSSRIQAFLEFSVQFLDGQFASLFVTFLCQAFNIGKAEDSDPIPHCIVTRKCPNLKTNIKDQRSYKTLTPIPVHPSGKESGKMGLKTKANFATQLETSMWFLASVTCLKKYTNFRIWNIKQRGNDMISELKLSAPFIWYLVRHQAATQVSSTRQFGCGVSTQSLWQGTGRLTDK